MKLKSKILVMALTAVGFISAANSQENIPVVPASVMKKNVPAPISPDAGAVGTVNENSVLTMKPGVNQIIPIAIGHPNRIVTPFSNPEVVSTSLTSSANENECGEVCIKENVVYVATDVTHPVTMFVTEKGTEAQALSVTMIPRRIPPREVFLKLDGGFTGSSMYASTKAKSWEESQPYVETIRSVFRKLAMGEIPQGYTMNDIPQGIVIPACSMPGAIVDFTKGQYLMGHHLNVFIGVVKNVSKQPMEVKEALCGSWDVAAVASWPLHILEPGQKTEIYVAKKEKRGIAPTSKRPSLLGAGY